MLGRTLPSSTAKLLALLWGWDPVFLNGATDCEAGPGDPPSLESQARLIRPAMISSAESGLSSSSGNNSVLAC